MDCIYKQAAIEIIQSFKTNTARSIEDEMPVDDVVDMLEDMIDDVENIPSVQPDQTEQKKGYCERCKHKYHQEYGEYPCSDCVFNCAVKIEKNFEPCEF